MRVKLIRIERAEDGVFGVLTINGQVVCLTIERPWLDNQKNISCIPAGEYTCKRVDSPKFKETFEVLNVPTRNYILFHAGNTIEDSLGCIIPGSKFGELRGKRAVLESNPAFIEFMTRLDGLDSFQLQIVNF